MRSYGRIGAWLYTGQGRRAVPYNKQYMRHHKTYPLKVNGLLLNNGQAETLKTKTNSYRKYIGKL